MIDDDKAIMMLEKALEEAQALLKHTDDFYPFALILHYEGHIKRLEQKCDDDLEESYLMLHDVLIDYVHDHPTTDIVVLVTQTTMPRVIVQEDGIRSSIRIHLEEQSQQTKAIASRYIYVPYQRVTSDIGTPTLHLLNPQAISFPSEFFPKKR